MSLIAMQGGATAVFADSFVYSNGDLYWSNNVTHKMCGKLAGAVNKKGYRKIEFNARKYGAHQIIFALHHGYIPEFIDHINGIKHDNRIENLRAATKAQNGYNRAGFSDCKNVSYRKDTKNWRVCLRVNGKPKYFGSYKDKELAALVAHEARLKYHGEFSNHV
jgi:hypothetical protein